MSVIQPDKLEATRAETFGRRGLQLLIVPLRSATAIASFTLGPRAVGGSAAARRRESFNQTLGWPVSSPLVPKTREWERYLSIPL